MEGVTYKTLRCQCFSLDHYLSLGTMFVCGTRADLIILILFQSLLFMAIATYEAPSYGKDGYVFPTFAIVIGNLFAVAPLLVILVVAAWEIWNSRGSIFQV